MALGSLGLVVGGFLPDDHLLGASRHVKLLDTMVNHLMLQIKSSADLSDDVIAKFNELIGMIDDPLLRLVTEQHDLTNEEYNNKYIDWEAALGTAEVKETAAEQREEELYICQKNQFDQKCDWDECEREHEKCTELCEKECIFPTSMHWHLEERWYQEDKNKCSFHDPHIEAAPELAVWQTCDPLVELGNELKKRADGKTDPDNGITGDAENPTYGYVEGDYFSETSEWKLKPEMVTGINAEYAKYLARSASCGGCQTTCDGKRKECDDKKAIYVATKNQCNEYEPKANVAICDFGRKYLDVCDKHELWKGHKALEEGDVGQYSTSDRVKEWISLNTIKCWLQHWIDLWQSKEEILDAEGNFKSPDTCVDTIDYSADHTVVNKEAEIDARWTTSDNNNFQTRCEITHHYFHSTQKRWGLEGMGLNDEDDYCGTDQHEFRPEIMRVDNHGPYKIYNVDFCA